MSLSVTIDRSALSLPDLVLAQDPAAAAWLPEDGVSEPAWVYRTTYAPDSAAYPGKRALTAVLDASSLPLKVCVRATDALGLGQVKRMLAEATSQWAYEITVTINGFAATYQADPCWPQWGQVDSGMTCERIAVAQVNVPINPPSGS